MTRPTRLTPEELEKAKGLCTPSFTFKPKNYRDAIKSLISHITALDEEIRELRKTRNELHHVATEQAILLHQIERK